VAPVLAFVGLLLVAVVSLWAVSQLDGLLGEAAADATPAPIVAAAVEDTPRPGTTTAPGASVAPVESGSPTAEPSGLEPTAEPIVVTPPSADRADVKGTILFTRLGDIWAASGTTLTPMTNSSSTKADSSPTWSPDGRFIYFIRTTKRELNDGKARFKGKYTLYPTDLMRMKGDGSGKPARVFESLISDSRGQWFRHVRQPTVNKSGTNVAAVSDGNDGVDQEVTLHIINSRSGKMQRVATPTEPAFGHNDPDFHPDGDKIAFTFNDSIGTNGNPRIGILNCQSKADCTKGKTRYLKSGYANPSWSPDGQLLVVEKIGSGGRDIAIVTSRGVERVQLTADGDSFSPVFSPGGDQIAYLRRDGADINLRVMTLDVDERDQITLVEDRAVTSDGQLDGQSGPSWYIPRDELPGRVAAPEANSEAGDVGEPTDGNATAEPASDASGDAPPPPPGS
jgi:Tol biopolymer transport system component